MPSFISKNGNWEAAKEKAVDINTGEVYVGPDREASKIIEEETGGLGKTIGMNANEDPQMLEVARQHGLTIEQWMERNKPSKEVEAKIEQDRQIVNEHKPGRPRKRQEVTKGGFYDGESPVEAFNKK